MIKELKIGDKVVLLNGLEGKIISIDPLKILFNNHKHADSLKLEEINYKL